MCTWGTEKTIQIMQTITVDACIADEIVALNAAGVRTINSCCGHGRGPSLALILLTSSEKARTLGYTTRFVSGKDLDYCEIVLGEGRSPNWVNQALDRAEKVVASAPQVFGYGKNSTSPRERADRLAEAEAVLRELGCLNINEMGLIAAELDRLRGELRATRAYVDKRGPETLPPYDIKAGPQTDEEFDAEVKAIPAGWLGQAEYQRRRRSGWMGDVNGPGCDPDVDGSEPFPGDTGGPQLRATRLAQWLRGPAFASIGKMMIGGAIQAAEEDIDAALAELQDKLLTHDLGGRGLP